MLRPNNQNFDNSSPNSNSSAIFSYGPDHELDVDIENASLRHNIVRELFKGNISSPIHDELKHGGLRILDVGCGSGTWLFEVSSDYPLCECIGMDKTKILIDNKPKNVNFVLANILEGFPFCDNSFDFVYVRNLSYDLTESQWIYLINECIRVLKSGCYIEVTENELYMNNAGPIMKNMVDNVLQFLSSRGVNLQITGRIQEVLESTRKLHKIIHICRPFPMGSWCKELKYACETYSYDIMRGISAKFGDVKTKKENEEKLQKLVAEANKYRSYFGIHKFYGRKV
ncbi:17146_t:CDS:2 [Cetraspora pellucida]|uniref:17146_t:CDS:1 n=1 Tax=Cetraspora pellucida TaxID=1433469 RepID=A0ACA9L1G4_9GLOM|nr:17146_t:CDS:2 [Cetraspora pellucida]